MKTTKKLSEDGLTVLDVETGLIWQQSGSKKYMNYVNAEQYVRDLNAHRFAGYNDWRLPTRDEAMSLLLLKPINNFYCDSMFDKTQRYIWTADKDSAGMSWCVGFYGGYCGRLAIVSDGYVRAVRS